MSLRPALLGVFCFLCVTAPHVQGQSIPDLIKGLGIEGLARDYLRPGADAVGYSLNSGLYHTARIEKGFHVWAGVRGVWAVVPETDRTFDAVLPSSMTVLGYPARVTTATVFGSQGAVLHSSLKDPSGNPYPDIHLPGGADLTSTFLAVPHLEIGTIAATRIMLRGLPETSIDPSIGKVRFWGIGMSHSPTNYIRLPFDVAIMASTQTFQIGDVVTVTNLNANVHASVTTGPITIFAGAAFESYDIDVTYTYRPPADASLPDVLDEPVVVALDFARSNRRFTAGVTFSLLPFIDITADYSFGIQDNITLGTGFTF